MQMLASMTWVQWLVALLIIVICCFFMLVILLQRGRGGGLAGAFGGAGGSSAFGAKTGDVFTWITVVVATVFLVVCVVANFMLQPPTDGGCWAESRTPPNADSLGGLGWRWQSTFLMDGPLLSRGSQSRIRRHWCRSSSTSSVPPASFTVSGHLSFASAIQC